MGVFKKLLAIYLAATALAVVVNWITTPLTDHSEGYPLWELLNWFLAVSVLIMLAENVRRKLALGRRDSGEGISREYLEANLCFGAAIVLTMWYFWNWFYGLFPENEPGEILLEIHLGFWGFIHPIFVLLGYATAWRLWRQD